MMNEGLGVLAQKIKMIEIRIKELELRLHKESDIKMKMSMQNSLKTNRMMLRDLQEIFWSEDSHQLSTKKYVGL